MIKHRAPFVAALMAIAAMALGSVALANSASVHTHQHVVAAHKSALPHRANAVKAANPEVETAGSSVDRDNIQSGDQSTPDQQSSTAQASSGGEKSASEQSNDGPGGHEDAPGNESTDHQFEGKE